MRYMSKIILEGLEEEKKLLKATVAQMSAAYEELRCRVQALTPAHCEVSPV